MTALLIIIAAIVLLFIGYVCYGGWLAKQWGIDPTKKTPAVEKKDGVDYVAAPPAVLMGHHFSSIAGAGPINGPILAAVFGWVPVFLWCVIGGIFFGGLQDFGSLFASIRNEGKSVGEIIKASMGKFAKRLFIIFALLVLILVIASFVNVVAGTFYTPYRTKATVETAAVEKVMETRPAKETTKKVEKMQEVEETVTKEDGSTEVVVKSVPVMETVTNEDGTTKEVVVMETVSLTAVEYLQKVYGLKGNAVKEADGVVTLAFSGDTKEQVKAAIAKDAKIVLTAAEEPSLGSGTVSEWGKSSSNQTTAMISILFIVLAVIYGIATNRFNVKTLPATIAGILCIVAMIWFGLNKGLVLDRNTWIIIVGLYIAVASLIPVWIMLQPRDYLSSFLLYSMMGIALAGIVYSAFAHNVEFTIPAFNASKLSTMFPTLFITVACGACSGFHSLIASGTSSKQLDNEKNAKAIGYGSMLIESGLGIISLIAVGVIYNRYTAGEFGSPAAAFGNGIAAMFGGSKTIVALLTLAVSVFALTSLDSATRLSRFMFSELFLKDDEETWKDAKNPVRKVLANPLFGTGLMVVIGCILGGLKLAAIWALFGSANQLLAGIALLAVAAWLGNVGKNNKMFFIPMAFMLAATLTQLIMTVIAQCKIIFVPDSTANWGNWFQLCFAAAMAVLAVILVIEGVRTFVAQAKAKKANA